MLSAFLSTIRRYFSPRSFFLLVVHEIVVEASSNQGKRRFPFGDEWCREARGRKSRAALQEKRDPTFGKKQGRFDEIQKA